MLAMLRGVTAALVTPLSEAGEVSEQCVARLVTALRPHVTALLPALSTGEGQALSDRQWHAVVSAAIRYAGGRPVLAGALRPDTAAVVTRARAAAALGARAVVATTPFGAEVTQHEMYRHFAELGRRAGLPVVVYHESAVSGNTADLDTLLRICALDSVVGVKDSAGSAAFTRQLVEARPGVPVLSGLEPLLLECRPVDGYAVSLANVEPALCADLFAGRAVDPAGRLARACERYGLAGDDWYRSLKAELCRRGVLETGKTIETGKVLQ
jgi:4-hydroxy-tetrahydrodipicolinate synthase